MGKRPNRREDPQTGGGRGRREAAAGAEPPPRRPKLPPRLIVSEDDVRDGVRALRRKCAIMRQVHDAAGDPPLRRRPAGFEGLARIIVGQQVSVASATAIWGRTAAACASRSSPALLALIEDAALGPPACRGQDPHAARDRGGVHERAGPGAA